LFNPDSKYSNLVSLALALMLFTEVVLPNLFGASALIYILTVIYGAITRELKFEISKMGKLFIAFYLIYLIGSYGTNHWELAGKTLEYKLSFILFPLLISLRPKQGGYKLSYISTGLILGIVITTVYGIINAALCLQNGGGKACILTGIISPVHHPTYFVAFWITGIALAWYGKKQNWQGYSWRWILPFTILGIIIHALSLSLAGILFILLVSFVALLVLIYKRFGKITALISLAILPVIGFLIVSKTPQIEGEYNAAKWYADQYIKDPKSFVRDTEYPMSGSQERLILWTVSAGEIKKHPFGVGTGNLEETMHDALIDLGQNELAEKNLNPHNQYLQTCLEVGVLGFLILLIIVVYGIITGLRNRNPVLILLSACLAFNSLFESMLQRQSGVVFFTVLILVLSSSALVSGRDEA